MNWSKIKNKLIFILVLLNIGLVLLYINKYRQERPYQISKETATKLEDQLDQKGIKLDVELSDRPRWIRPLLVTYQEESPEKINERFFSRQGQIFDDGSQVSLVRNHEEVKIINNSRLVYENLDPSSSSPNLRPEELVKNFMIDKDYNTGDMVLSKKVERGNSSYLEYIKSYNDKLIETSYARFHIDNGVIRKMDRLWIDVIEEDNRLIEIEPSYKAVMSLLDDEEFYNTTIEDVDLCYYFNPQAQGILEDNSQAVRGRAIAAWRISFDNGETIIVDNY